jgi:hypothetical protein
MKEFDVRKLLEKRTQIIAGRIGSGKTEVAINLAIKLKSLEIPVKLFDMDIVKPYVRIRDVVDKLSPYGLDLVLHPLLQEHLMCQCFLKMLFLNLWIRNPTMLLMLEEMHTVQEVLPSLEISLKTHTTCFSW